MTITIERTEPTIQIIDLPAMGRAARLASRQLALLSSAAKRRGAGDDCRRTGGPGGIRHGAERTGHCRRPRQRPE
ncbi:MAG: hypothetical protein R2856_19640 [Caldilineaceae bacterium]